MGTDCTVVIEREGDLGWEITGVMHLPRDYDLFELLKENGASGYPEDIDRLSKEILERVEVWGEGHMGYDAYRKLLMRRGCEGLDIIRKKLRGRCRVIYRFDN